MTHRKMKQGREIGNAGRFYWGRKISVLNEIVKKCLMKMLTEH